MQRTLHVACMPYPTPQGSQALVGAMVRALRDHGHDARLLVYGKADDSRGADPPWLERSGGAARSERSGPSLSKVGLDLRMVAALRRRWRAQGQPVVVAHNVEAAIVAQLAQVGPHLYVAHTRFDAELPTYSPAASLGRPAATLGSLLDRIALRAEAAGAVSPALADALGARFLPPPWERSPVAAGPADRVLYAGNLDGYQGWELVVEACARAELPLLVATASDPAPLRRHAAAAGLRVLEVMPLRGERTRREAHDRAAVVAVPRRAPGGLPIKLLDALARGRPVVAQRRALAGLDHCAPPIAGVVTVRDDDRDAFAAGLREARAAPPTGGRAWIAEACAPGRFVEAFGALVAALR